MVSFCFNVAYYKQVLAVCSTRVFGPFVLPFQRITMPQPLTASETNQHEITRNYNMKHNIVSTVCIFQSALGLLNPGMNAMGDKMIQSHSQNNNMPDIR